MILMSFYNCIKQDIKTSHYQNLSLTKVETNGTPLLGIITGNGPLVVWVGSLSIQCLKHKPLITELGKSTNFSSHAYIFSSYFDLPLSSYNDWANLH